MARLYFYRDAHRVAQILNRRAQSYNRQDVTMRRQFADKARQEAESLTTARQIAERSAVETAKKSRELQNQLSDAQRAMNYSLQQMQSVARNVPANADEQQRQFAQQQLAQLETATLSLSSQVQQLESQLRVARDTEVAANEQMQQASEVKNWLAQNNFAWRRPLLTPTRTHLQPAIPKTSIKLPKSASR